MISAQQINSLLANLAHGKTQEIPWDEYKALLTAGYVNFRSGHASGAATAIVVPPDLSEAGHRAGHEALERRLQAAEKAHHTRALIGALTASERIGRVRR